MKIISSKEYKRLKEVERKYDLIVGNSMTLVIGGRTKMARLMNLEKEELVRIIIDLNNVACQLKRKKEVFNNEK